MDTISNISQTVTETTSQRSSIKWVLRKILYLLTHRFSVIRTVYFNFHYFPINIALKFPVFIYRKVRLKSTKGKIELDMDNIKAGSVKIGETIYGFHTRHDETIWEQHGGTVVFGEGTRIGRGTFLTIGKDSELKLGQGVMFGGNDKIICRKSITIGEYTMVAWEVMIIDTDFHHTVNTIFESVNCAEKPIVVGNNNWLGFGSTLLKGSVTPNHCIVSANITIQNNHESAGENIVLGQETSAKVIAKHITFDRELAQELAETANMSPEWEEFDKLIKLRNKRRAG